MSDYFGDIRLGDTIDIKFTTRQISGAPSTLSSSPVISAYPANSTTQLTAGITLSVDFDSVTGYNNVRVVATSGNGYATATNYDLCITTGTVNSVSVVGESIGSFSIENRSALMPTTPALTLDVSAGGEAGVDWANVGSKTTTVDLSGTTIKTTQKVDVDTIKTQAVTLAGAITFPAATVASTTNITAGTITTASNLTTNNDKAGYTLVATPPTSAQIFTAVWTTQLTEAYAALHAVPTAAQALFEVRALLAEKAVVTTTLTANKVDGTTAAETFTLNDGTNPTAITRAS